MAVNKNHVRSLEALIAGAHSLAENGERLLAQMLHGSQSKQLASDVQTPKQLMVWWNDWAGKLGKPTITLMSKKRKDGFRARLSAGQWDLKLINQRLQTLARLALTSPWFTLDFFLCSESNFAKFIDGNYSSDSILNATASARADSVDSPHKDKQQVMARHRSEFERVAKQNAQDDAEYKKKIEAQRQKIKDQEAEERKAKGLE